MDSYKVCDSLPISEDGRHYAWIATTMEDCKNHERFFVRCVSDQKISHTVKAQRPRNKIGAITQAAEKFKFFSFRGTLRAEESLILLNLIPGEIARFVRNDKIIYFFRSLYGRPMGMEQGSESLRRFLIARGPRRPESLQR